MKLPIRIFNTLSRKYENLITIDPNHLKMYVCGPTVYDRPHLGNARSVVVYDMFFRLFKFAFPKVTYVRNITDIDDKINAAAKERKISINQLTSKIIELFYEDIDALNVMRPSFEPLATQHLPEIIAMVENLISSGHAYISSNHVLFDVSSYKDYGQLSNRNINEMISGSRIEIATYKRSPLDFVLWKPADDEDDASSIFDSPWGKGRPGWHIECSAMSSKYLGKNFDIHGGGADLQFPHHENEIAQSCCANKNSHFAKFWIHNGFLTVNSEKMSKSLKNFVTVRDLLDDGLDGVAIRYMLLSSHYRKPLDFNQKAINDAKIAIEKFNNAISGADNPSDDAEVFPEVLSYLADDLNMAKVFAFMHEKVREINKDENQRTKDSLAKTLEFLGFISKKESSPTNLPSIDYIEKQIELRQNFKAAKDFAKADEIRNHLTSLGVLIEDVSKDKTIWKIVN